MSNKNKYNVTLTNYSGAIFDSGAFTNLKQARKWACGRGYIYAYGHWYRYFVEIFKNGKSFIYYKTH